MSTRENFCGFYSFYRIGNLFLQVMALLTYNTKMLSSKSFTANSHFPLKPQKFSPSEVLPYTVPCTPVSPGDPMGTFKFC